jgi:hypothetical protein
MAGPKPLRSSAVGVPPARDREALTLAHGGRLQTQTELSQVVLVVFALRPVTHGLAKLVGLHSLAVVRNPHPRIVAVKLDINRNQSCTSFDGVVHDVGYGLRKVIAHVSK